MDRYSVGAYTYEGDSPDTMIYDGLTGIPLSLGYELVSQERGDTVRVVALGVKDDTAGPVPFATLRPCAYSLASEYDVRAVRCPQTGQWVLIGYMGV